MENIIYIGIKLFNSFTSNKYNNNSELKQKQQMTTVLSTT